MNDSDSSDKKEFERSVFNDKALKLPDASETKQKYSDENTPTTNCAVSNADNHQPGCSSGGPFIDEGIASLTTGFPDEEIQNVRQAMIRYKDVELAACALIGADQNSEEVEGNYTVCDTLGKLRAGMKSFMSAERLKVYEEDINLLLICFSITSQTSLMPSSQLQ